MVIILAMAFGFSGCSSSRKSRASGESGPSKSENAKARAFALEYSKKLGISVPETANRDLLINVYDWIGVPYKYGGNDKKGVDCSGLISNIYPAVYKKQVPRNTADLEKNAEPVKKDGLSEGDLVFFKINTRKVGHAGIYLFNNYFVHASSSRGVMISQLGEAYWSKYFVGGGRFSK